MSVTDLLALPYIAGAQAQKHVTHNEALRILDAVVHIRVEDRDRNDPPSEPVAGQRHALGAAPTGAFAGHAGAIAAFQDGAWAFHVPQEGWVIWDASEAALMVFDGEAWVPVQPDLQDVPLLGINATADETNRLAVASEATLLSHDGASHRLKINKAAAGDTGSLLFQTAWSGRAEIGLAGDDDLHLKVSASGSTWLEALVVDRATGAVTLPLTAPAVSPFNLFRDAGRFGGAPEPQSSAVSSFSAPSYVIAQNGATIVGGPKFITNNNDYGGTAGALDTDVKALIDKLKDASSRRFGVEFFLLDVTAGSGTSTSRTINTVVHYLPFSTFLSPLPPQWTFNCHILTRSGSVGAWIGTGDQLYIDGVRFADPQQIVAADGWKQVTRRNNRNPRQFPGYDNIFHGIYATPGTAFYLAAPVLAPGFMAVAPNLYYGVVPSLEAWR